MLIATFFYENDKYLFLRDKPILKLTSYDINNMIRRSILHLCQDILYLTIPILILSIILRYLTKCLCLKLNDVKYFNLLFLAVNNHSIKCRNVLLFPA